MTPPKCKVCGNTHWGPCFVPGPATTKKATISQRQADKIVREHRAKPTLKSAPKINRKSNAIRKARGKASGGRKAAGR